MSNQGKSRLGRWLAIVFYAALLAGALWYAARAQSEWSHGRLECQAPNIGTVVEAIREEDGTVHSPRDIGYIGAQDAVRHFDYVMLPGRSYYNGCMFTQKDPITYEDWKYLPFIAQRGVSRFPK